MPAFAFDEDTGIDANLTKFFEHLKQYDEDFATLLKEELPKATGSAFNRSEFNKKVAALLDTPSATKGGY